MGNDSLKTGRDNSRKRPGSTREFAQSGGRELLALGCLYPSTCWKSEVGCSAKWAESNQGEDAVAGRVAER